MLSAPVPQPWAFLLSLPGLQRPPHSPQHCSHRPTYDHTNLRLELSRASSPQRNSPSPLCDLPSALHIIPQDLPSSCTPTRQITLPAGLFLHPHPTLLSGLAPKPPSSWISDYTPTAPVSSAPISLCGLQLRTQPHFTWTFSPLACGHWI